MHGGSCMACGAWWELYGVWCMVRAVSRMVYGLWFMAWCPVCEAYVVSGFASWACGGENRLHEVVAAGIMSILSFWRSE